MSNRIDEYKASSVARTFVAQLLAVGIDPEILKAAWNRTVTSRIGKGDLVMRGMVRMAENSSDVQEIVK
jgi:hypothetical protein